MLGIAATWNCLKHINKKIIKYNRLKLMRVFCVTGLGGLYLEGLFSEFYGVPDLISGFKSHNGGS